MGTRPRGFKDWQNEGNMVEPETKVALVLMEAGTPWPKYVADIRGRASSAVVEAQQPSEALTEFSSRVVIRLQRLAQKRVSIPVAVLVVNERSDFEATTVRYRTARAVLAEMLRAGEGELVIVAEEHVPEELRHELVAFAGSLCDGLGGSRIGVRVRFATKSGVHPLVSAMPKSEPAPERLSYA